MQIAKTLALLGLILASSLLVASTASAQWNNGNYFPLHQDQDEVWNIVLEPRNGAFDSTGFRLPSIPLPEVPGYDPPPRDDGGSVSILLPPELPTGWPDRGGYEGDDWPAYEIPIARPNLPDVDLIPTRPSNPVPEPSAALVFGLGMAVAGNVSRRSRAG